MYSRSGFWCPGLSKIIVVFLPGYLSGKKFLTSGLTETHERAGAGRLSSCHVVGMPQEDASRIGKCKGAPIRSGVSVELATELLPASPGHLIN